MAGKRGGKADRFERKAEKLEKKEMKMDSPAMVEESAAAPANTPIKVYFTNNAGSEAMLYLVDNKGVERLIRTLERGERREIKCLSGSNWNVKAGGKEMRLSTNRDGANYQITADQIKMVV